LRNLCGNTLGNNKDQKLKEFEAVALPLMDRLYGAALTMTRVKLDAEDLVQETYMKAWRNFDTFELRRNFRSWIFRILTNNFINVYRTKKLQPLQLNFETTCATSPQEDTSEFDRNRGFSFTENYEELFDDTITAALDKLPQHHRIVVLLCDVSELKYKEIAEALNIPIVAVAKCWLDI